MSSVDILLVEDNHGDVGLIEQAFEKQALPGTLYTVQTGEAALDWLYDRGENSGVPRPDLILLDWNLPTTSGRSVLEQIKSDPDLRRLPVIVLTGSQAETDLADAYDAQANAYLTKPVDPVEFAELMQLIVGFWVYAVVLPPVPDLTDEQS